MLARSRVLLGSLLVAAVSSSSLSPALAQTPPASGAPANPVAPAPPPAAPATTAPASAPTTVAPAPTAPAPTATTAAPGAPAPTAPAAPATSAVVSPSWPLVTFAPDQARGSLQRFDKGAGGDSWTTVCQGPCSKNLDVRHGYRVGGEGVVPSPWFKLPASEEPFSLKADTGSKTTRTVGQIMAWASPVFGAVGATLLATGDDREAWDGRTYAGGALLVGGVALLVTGLALIGTSSTTTSLERAAPPQSARRTRPDASF